MNNDIKKYKTKSGKTRYQIRIYAGKYKANGQSNFIRKKGFKSLDEAENAYISIKHDIKNGTYVTEKPKHVRFKKVYRKWINVYANGVKESTLATTIRILEGHVLPELGNMYIDEITVVKCQQAVNKWFKQAPKTFKRYIRYANDVFKYAEHLELISSSPMDKVIRPKQKKDEKDVERLYTEKRSKKFYTKKELKRFLEYAKEYKLKAYTFFQILGYGGLRRGEALALQWRDVDFINHTLTINKTVSKGLNNRCLIQTPKTKASVRTISLDDETIEVLKEWQHEQLRERNDANVIPIGINNSKAVNNLYLFEGMKHGYPTNFPMSETTAFTWNDAIAKKAGLPHINLHGFRHTHASLLFDARIPVEEAKARLGHEKITTTIDIYTHLTKQREEETAMDFAKFMHRA